MQHKYCSVAGQKLKNKNRTRKLYESGQSQIIRNLKKVLCEVAYTNYGNNYQEKGNRKGEIKEESKAGRNGNRAAASYDCD